MRHKYPRYQVGQIVILKHSGEPIQIYSRKIVHTKVAQNSYVEYESSEVVKDSSSYIFYEDELRPLNDKEIGADWERL